MLDSTPRPGDTENELLQKVLIGLGGTPRPGDLDTGLQRKILDALGGGFSPGDSKNILYRKIGSALSVVPFPGDDTNKLLFRIVNAVNGQPRPGDTDAELLFKWSDNSVPPVPPGPVPDVPTLDSATPVDSVPKVTLVWTPAGTGGTPDFFDIYRNENGGSYSLLASVSSGIGSPYDDAAVSYGVLYGYKIKARNSGGSSAFSNEKTATATVDPSIYSGLQAWWDADFLVGFADGDPVGAAGKEFVDRQGDTNHYGRQSGAAQRPIYKTGIANGKPAILFTWDTGFVTQHYLDLTNGADANSITPAGDYTVICVVKPSSLSTRVGGTIIGNAYAGNPSGMQIPFTPTTMISYDAISNPQSNVFTDQTDVLGMFTFIRSSGNAKQYFNTTDKTSAVTAILAGHYSFMGAANAPNLQARWGGYVMEIVIYNTELSLAQVTNLYNNYYKPKWGLP